MNNYGPQHGLFQPPKNGGNGGPQPNTGAGRNRNTARSLYGGVQKANPFPLGPGSAAQYATQRQNLLYANKIARASLRSQATQVRAQYKLGRQNAVESGRAGLTDVSGTMAERGLLGSSTQFAEEEGVRGATQGALAEAYMGRTQGLMETNQSKLQAEAELRMGLTQLAMQKAAEQREMALRAFGSGGANPWF